MDMQQLRTQLDEVGELSWGQRFRAYREEAGLTMEQAAEQIAQFIPTSHMTIARLEQRSAEPTMVRQRQVAALALIFYGVHPKVMELGDVDLPALDFKRLDRELGKKGSPAQRRMVAMRTNRWSAGNKWPAVAASVA